MSLGVKGPLRQFRFGLVDLDKADEGLDAKVGERHIANVALQVHPKAVSPESATSGRC